MTPKERAIDITTKLNAAEATGDGDLTALHATLLAGLEEHAGLLGFDAADLIEIEQAGNAARGGGTNKDGS